MKKVESLAGENRGKPGVNRGKSGKIGEKLGKTGEKLGKTGESWGMLGKSVIYLLIQSPYLKTIAFQRQETSMIRLNSLLGLLDDCIMIKRVEKIEECS